MFDCHTQFPEICIIELFVVLEESHFSFCRSTPDLAHVPVSQLQHSPTFVMASHMQNENVHNENADDLISDPSFQQLVMQITELLPWDGPIADNDFIVNDRDDDEELVEIPFDNDSSLNRVAKHISQS